MEAIDPFFREKLQLSTATPLVTCTPMYVRSMLDSYCEEVVQFQLSKSKLRDDYDFLQAENNTLKHDIMALQEKCWTHVSTISNLREDCAIIQDEKHALEYILALQKTHQTREGSNLKGLKGKIRKLKKKCKTIEDDKSNLEDYCVDLRNQNDALEHEVGFGFLWLPKFKYWTLDDLRDLKDYKAILKGENDFVFLRGKTIRQLQERCQFVKDDCAALRTESSTLKHETEQLQETCLTLKDDCAALRTENGALKDEIGKLQGKCQARLDRILNLRDDCAGLREVHDAKEKAFNNLLDSEKAQSWCVVCQNRRKSVLLMPCRHLCCCTECAEHSSLFRCPICRQQIDRKINVYS